MRYPHTIRFERPNPNPGTPGQFVNDVWVEGTAPGGPSLILYDGRADVQEAGLEFPRAADGEPAFQADAVAVLEDREAAADLKPGDVATIGYPPDRRHPSGRSKDSQVARVTEFDGTVFLRFVQ